MTPFVVELVDAPTRETTVVDVLVQALGVAGGIMVVALLAGLLAGGLLIGIRILRPYNSLNGAASERIRLHLDRASRP